MYLQPPVGVNPGSLKVEAKARYYGLDLSHSQHVQFHGIQLFGCSIKTDSATEDILINGMNARYVGHWETSGNVRPPKEQLVAMAMEARDITLQNSTLYGAAGTLVTLNGSGNRIINCLISEAGYAGLNSECVGIYGSRQLVSHNTIHSSGRSVLGFGATRSKVAFNDISRAGLLTWDVGLFTTGNTDAGNSEVCFNWFHDTPPKGWRAASFFPPAPTTCSSITMWFGTAGRVAFTANCRWNTCNSSITRFTPHRALMTRAASIFLRSLTWTIKSAVMCSTMCSPMKSARSVTT